MRMPMPCRAAAGAWHSPTMHRLPRAQAAPTQPVVWGAGGSRGQCEMGLLQALQQRRVHGEEVWLLWGIRCLSCS